MLEFSWGYYLRAIFCLILCSEVLYSVLYSGLLSLKWMSFASCVGRNMMSGISHLFWTLLTFKLSLNSMVTWIFSNWYRLSELTVSESRLDATFTLRKFHFLKELAFWFRWMRIPYAKIRWSWLLEWCWISIDKA